MTATHQSFRVPWQCVQQLFEEARPPPRSPELEVEKARHGVLITSSDGNDQPNCSYEEFDTAPL